jgi:hypothetical protein
MVSMAMRLMAFAPMVSALKFSLQPKKATRTGWTDWAYSDLGQDKYEEKSLSDWERNYLQDEWQGMPNPLMEESLTSPEVVPNDSNLGVATPGINAEVTEYNGLVEAHGQDLAISDDNDLFTFSSDRTSAWAKPASDADDTAAVTSANDDEAALLKNVEIMRSPPSFEKEDAAASRSPPHRNGSFRAIGLPKVAPNALIKRLHVLAMNLSNSGVDSFDAQRVAHVAGTADGVTNSSLLAAYWDHQRCGPGIDDQNAHWCGSGMKVPPACQRQVEVHPKVCASGVADLQYVLGNGTFDEGIVLDKCRYAFYAQYACGAVSISNK